MQKFGSYTKNPGEKAAASLRLRVSHHFATPGLPQNSEIQRLIFGEPSLPSERSSFQGAFRTSFAIDLAFRAVIQALVRDLKLKQ